MGIMVSDRDIQLFLDSYQRCQPHPEFFQRFYDTLLQEHPHFQPLLFDKNIKKLITMLPLAIYGNMGLICADPVTVNQFKELGQLHANFGFPPEFMDDWLDCLINVVAITDRKFDEPTKRSWLQILGTGITLMKNQLR